MEQGGVAGEGCCRLFGGELIDFVCYVSGKRGGTLQKVTGGNCWMHEIRQWSNIAFVHRSEHAWLCARKYSLPAVKNYNVSAKQDGPGQYWPKWILKNPSL